MATAFDTIGTLTGPDTRTILLNSLEVAIQQLPLLYARCGQELEALKTELAENETAAVSLIHIDKKLYRENPNIYKQFDLETSFAAVSMD